MISLISTVFNESGNIKNLLSDISKQSVTPDEIIIVDAGSTDGTQEALKQSDVTLISKEKVGRSEGRNIAVKKALGDIIVTCDGGTRLDRYYIEKLLSCFTDEKVDIVSGFFRPDTSKFFEKCLASATIPILDEIEPDKFLPSSRSLAFRKKVWQSVGGYPEWLSVCEDLIFDIKLKKAGFKFKFQPEAIVYWKPRSTAREFFRQYLSYARGDGHARLWTVRHLIRYTAYFTGFLLIYLSLTVSGLWLLPFFAAQLGYFSKFYYRHLGHFPDDDELKMIAALPVISALVVIGDLAKMVGYPVGVYERLTCKINYEAY